MSSIVIRPASITDITQIVKIRVEALTDEELSGFVVPEDNLYTSMKKLQKMWNKENRLKDGLELFVAESQGNIVGFIAYNMESCDDNIDNLIVAKKEQRKGIGRSLVEYIEELAKSRGYNFIRTDTTENAKGVPWKSYGFWKKMGYKDTGERVSSKYDFKNIPLFKRLK
jgi:ribosomal protein S18 acetylase RimI-like enzyme